MVAEFAFTIETKAKWRDLKVFESLSFRETGISLKPKTIPVTSGLPSQDGMLHMKKMSLWVMFSDPSVRRKTSFFLCFFKGIL